MNSWTIICQFGYEDVFEEFGGSQSNAHRLENIVTLEPTLHDFFDNLELWFEATVGLVPGFHFPTVKDGLPPGYSPFIQSRAFLNSTQGQVCAVHT